MADMVIFMFDLFMFIH